MKALTRKTKTAKSGHHYLVKIWHEEADACFIAEVPALAGCVSHGGTFTQAAKNIQEAIDLWLEDAKGAGDAIPEPDLAAEVVEMYRPVISVSKLARRAGINPHTLASKLRRHAPFTPSEAAGIRSALATGGHR